LINILFYDPNRNIRIQILTFDKTVYREFRKIDSQEIYMAIILGSFGEKMRMPGSLTTETSITEVFSNFLLYFLSKTDGTP
jgi:hypothetical protein